MDIELEKLKKLEHALHDAIDILRDWQVEEVKEKKMEKNVCMACKGTGVVKIGKGIKGLTRCPYCNGSGVVKQLPDVCPLCGKPMELCEE